MAAKKESEKEAREAFADLARGLIEAVVGLSEKVEYQTTALHYLADVIGFSADKFNTGGATIKEQATLPDKDQPLVQPKAAVKKAAPKKDYTFEDIRSLLNGYARLNGKDAALKLVEKYSNCFDLQKVDKKDYAKLAQEAA